MRDPSCARSTGRSFHRRIFIFCILICTIIKRIPIDFGEDLTIFDGIMPFLDIAKFSSKFHRNNALKDACAHYKG